MFGVEGERMAAKRELEKRQYAQDLLQQMAEKNPKTIISKPNQYSNYENNMTRNTSSFGPPIVQPVINRNNNNTRPVEPFSTVPNRSYVFNRAPLQNAPPTSLAPLSINLGNPKQEPISVLPRAPHNNSSDPASFPERLQGINQIVMSIESSLSSFNSSFNSLESNTLPMIQSSIQQLRGDVERTSTTEISVRVRSLGEVIKYTRGLIETSHSGINNEIQSTRDRITELGTAIQQFASKFNDVSESTKGGFIGVKSDQSRNRGVIESTLQRLSTSESIFQKIQGETKGSSQGFDSIDSSVASNFNGFQNTIGDLVLSISRQLSEEIKKEGDNRVIITQGLQSNVEQLNSRASSTIGKLKALISDLSSSFGKSMSSMQTAVGQSIVQTQNETDAYNSDLSIRLDSLISDSESNFNAIKTEIISTIQEVKANSAGSFLVIEDTLKNEASVRKRNSDEILSKFAHFQKVIENEMHLQRNNISEEFNQVRQNGYQVVQSVTEPVYMILQPLLENEKRITETEQQMNDIEHLLHICNSQFVESITSLNRNYDDVLASSKRLKEDIYKGFDSIEKRIAVFENPTHNQDLEKREELQNKSIYFDDTFNARFQDVEEQLGVLLSNITEITLGYSVFSIKDDNKPIKTEKFEFPKKAQISNFVIEKKDEKQDPITVSTTNNLNSFNVSDKIDIIPQKSESVVPDKDLISAPQIIETKKEEVSNRDNTDTPVPSMNNLEPEIPKIIESPQDSLVFNPGDFVISFTDKPKTSIPQEISLLASDLIVDETSETNPDEAQKSISKIDSSTIDSIPSEIKPDETTEIKSDETTEIKSDETTEITRSTEENDNSLKQSQQIEDSKPNEVHEAKISDAAKTMGGLFEDDNNNDMIVFDN